MAKFSPQTNGNGEMTRENIKCDIFLMRQKNNRLKWLKLAKGETTEVYDQW